MRSKESKKAEKRKKKESKHRRRSESDEHDVVGQVRKRDHGLLEDLNLQLNDILKSHKLRLLKLRILSLKGNLSWPLKINQKGHDQDSILVGKILLHRE